MSQPVYQLGEQVHTPAHGDGVVVTINRGACRGRTWREISYTIKIPGASHRVVYYESELTSRSLTTERHTQESLLPQRERVPHNTASQHGMTEAGPHVPGGILRTV